MRKIEIAVLSDLHIGIYGCQHTQILSYLKSIDPNILILNGDIIDIWNYNKYSFSKNHIKIVRYFIEMIDRGTTIYYITGNHDEALRKISGIKLSNLHILDHLVIDVDGKKTWIFHGDVFDATTKGWSKIIAKLGGKGYDILIFINKLINDGLQMIGREKISMSKKIKNSIKSAVKWIANFENTAIELAKDQEFDFVICGHIHQPKIKPITHDKKLLVYMNSGDWVENCTGLEYNKGVWKLVQIKNSKLETLDEFHSSVGEDSCQNNALSKEYKFNRNTTKEREMVYYLSLKN